MDKLKKHINYPLAMASQYYPTSSVSQRWLVQFLGHLPNYKKQWNKAVELSMPLLILTVLFDFFLSGIISNPGIHFAIGFIEVVCSTFIFIDLAMGVLRTKNKYSYLKKNFVRIIAVFPFAMLFRVLWVFQLEAIMPAVVFGAWLPNFGSFQKLLKLEHISALAERFR